MQKIILSVTVDWEGENTHGVHDLKLLRKQIGKQIGEQIPLTHFICPSYFLSNSKATLRKLQSVVLPHDEVALHFHSLKKLVLGAGVNFKTDKNFYRSLPAKTEALKQKLPKIAQNLLFPTISGRGVPISVYRKDEIHKLISFSREVLQNTFDTPITGFRAGGWLANDIVLDVLSEQGFQYDSSAVPPQIFSNGFSKNSLGNLLDDYGDKNGIFTEYMLKLWGNNEQTASFLSNTKRLQIYQSAITPNTQPFLYSNMVEMPNNGGMSDFASPEATMLPALEQAYNLSQTQNTSYLNVGFHQEGEVSLKLPFVRFIKQIPEHIAKAVTYTTVNKAATNFKSAINGNFY